MPEDALAHPLEQPVRKRIVKGMVASWCRPNVRAGPDEAIELGDDDPASIAVQSELLLRIRRNFYRIGRRLGCVVGDGSHQDQGSRFSLNACNHHDGGPILSAAFLS